MPTCRPRWMRCAAASDRGHRVHRRRRAEGAPPGCRARSTWCVMRALDEARRTAPSAPSRHGDDGSRPDGGRHAAAAGWTTTNVAAPRRAAWPLSEGGPAPAAAIAGVARAAAAGPRGAAGRRQPDRAPVPKQRPEHLGYRVIDCASARRRSICFARTFDDGVPRRGARPAGSLDGCSCASARKQRGAQRAGLRTVVVMVTGWTAPPTACAARWPAATPTSPSRCTRASSSPRCALGRSGLRVAPTDGRGPPESVGVRA